VARFVEILDQTGSSLGKAVTRTAVTRTGSAVTRTGADVARIGLLRLYQRSSVTRTGLNIFLDRFDGFLPRLVVFLLIARMAPNRDAKNANSPSKLNYD